MFLAMTFISSSSVLSLSKLFTKNVFCDGKNVIQLGNGLLLLNNASYIVLPSPSKSKVFSENENWLVLPSLFFLTIGF